VFFFRYENQYIKRANERAMRLERGVARPPKDSSTPTESAENRSAQRRHGLGRRSRDPASTSHGRLRSGVDLFGRASRGSCAEPSGKIMRNKRRKHAYMAFGIVFLILIHASWTTTRLRRAEASRPCITPVFTRCEDQSS